MNTYMMDGVVVVPEHTSILRVRVVVVFILARLRDIFGPTIKWRTRVGAMEVYRVCELRTIDKADYGLRASRYDEGWSRGDPIITNEGSRLRKVWVDLLLEGFDVDLIVEDVLSIHGVCDSPKTLYE